jgi:hypothetical protein
MRTKVAFVLAMVSLFWIADSQAMNPFRKAFVFFAVHRDGAVIAVQSNPLIIADDSESNDYTLLFSSTGGGGSHVPGFAWQNGTAYGGTSSEGRLHASTLAETYWSSNARLHAHFELRDTDTALINSWDTPIFLRTIEHIEFAFLQGGSSMPQTIPGSLPSSPPDYDFTGFSWAATPWGGLGGATITFNPTDNGRTTDLSVTGTPASGWAQDDAPFDLVITTQSSNPDDVCTAEFRGLSWDGLDTPTLAAQPKVTLRRLESGGAPLSGYYWIRGQTGGDPTINAALPSVATLTGVIQDAPHALAEVALDADGGLSDLSFTPATPATNHIVVRMDSNTHAFRSANSPLLPLELRAFNIDYAAGYDWLLPYADNPGAVPTTARTLAVGGGDSFDWSNFVDTFSGGTDLFLDSGIWGVPDIRVGWLSGDLIAGDNGNIDVSLKRSSPGWPGSDVRVSVRIDDGSSDKPQISIENGFIKLDTTNGATPLAIDCSSDAHNGRMVFDEMNELLYICTPSGWITK